MRIILAIAKNTFKELIRDRLFTILLTFGILFVLSSIILGSISLGQDIKIIKDLGLAAIYLFTLISTLFLGSSLISKEFEKRTIYLIFSKDVRPAQFITGKFLGFLSCLILNIFLMGLIYLLVILVKSKSFDLPAVLALLFNIFEMSIIASLLILFSSFARPLSAFIYGIIFVYIGHSLPLLLQATIKSGHLAKTLVLLVYNLLPNLEKFNIRNSVVYGLSPTLAQFSSALIYAAGFTIIFLWLTSLVLEKQEY